LLHIEECTGFKPRALLPLRHFRNAAAGIEKTLGELGVAQVQMEAKAALPATQHPLLQRHRGVALLQRLEL
jgi:hypothetical protein